MDRKTTDSIVTAIGIDIGKNTFPPGWPSRARGDRAASGLSRGHVATRLASMAPCLVGMEACVGAHQLSRQLIARGHDVKLVPAQYVKPFLKGQKNDFRDAEVVPTKSVDQLDLQALHRVRSRLVG